MNTQHQNFRTVAVNIIVKDNTLEDYKDSSNDDVIDAFMTYYNINREDFYIEAVE
jgi:hypothetical protein